MPKTGIFFDDLQKELYKRHIMKSRQKFNFEVDSQTMEWLWVCQRLSGLSLAEFADVIEVPTSTIYDLLNKDAPRKENWQRSECLARKAAGLTAEQFQELRDNEYLSKQEREEYKKPSPRTLGRPKRKKGSSQKGA